MNANRKSEADRVYQNIRAVLVENGVEVFGLADLADIAALTDTDGQCFDRAISFAVYMNPDIMAGIKNGPNQIYAEEYARVNAKIDALASQLVDLITKAGFKARTFAASKRTDPVGIKGDFPHKTAATRGGLGWVGRNCQLVTRKHGPWIRLGTVFTDLPLNCATPVAKSHCGKCNICVEACPAGALTGEAWEPGIAREQVLDVLKCDTWKKEHYYQFHKGHNCGICSAVCPFGK